MAQLALSAARVRLGPEAHRACREALEPGQVKRVAQGGVLVGYFVACPACGTVRPHLAADAGLREEGGLLVSAERPLPCACGLALRVADGWLEAAAA